MSEREAQQRVETGVIKIEEDARYLFVIETRRMITREESVRLRDSFRHLDDWWKSGEKFIGLILEDCTIHLERVARTEQIEAGQDETASDE